METLPLPKAFTWYAMVRGGTATTSFDSSILPLGTFDTFNDFCRYWNHVPKPRDVFDGVHMLRIASKHMAYGYCIFEEGTRPEWEDAGNRGGVDLVCRLAACAPEVLQTHWDALTLLLLNDALAPATGIRLLQKPDYRRGGVTYKLEVWCAATEAARVAETLRCETGGLAFHAVERHV